MPKLKVHLKARSHIYIHNDIGNATLYFKRRIDDRIARNDREGIGHEIMAGLTLLAFEVEARFNFLGAKLMPEWKERAPALEKMRTVCAHLAVALDPKVRLYLSVVKLKELRDMLAHGKPINKVFDEEVVATAEELEAQRIIDAGWEAQINHAFFSDAYADVERIWGELLTKSGLSVFETITHGTRQISFIEHVR